MKTDVMEIDPEMKSGLNEIQERTKEDYKTIIKRLVLFEAHDRWKTPKHSEESKR